MKIAFIHPSSPTKESTGATYSANQIIDGLSKKGHDLTVYCLGSAESSDKPYRTERLLRDEVSYRSSTSQLNEEIVERKEELGEFDIIYSYPMMTIPGLGKIRPEISTKIVVTLNAYGAICPTNSLSYRRGKHSAPGSLRCLKCVFNRTLSESGLKETPINIIRGARNLKRLRDSQNYMDNIDCFFALTENVKERYVNAGFPGDRIEIVPPILDKKFSIDHKSDFEEPYKLLFVGYLKKHKGAHNLVQIMEELQESTEKKFRLTIVGEGPMRPKIEKQVANSPAGQLIELRGRVPNDELPRVYANHDLFVYPVEWDEPFGRVFIESLLAGTPVVSTYTGVAASIEEINTVKDANPGNLALEIKKSLLQKDAGEISNGLGQSLEDYDQENIVKKIESNFAKIAR
jgi:glycosyltransferase involved in cell wall biosynthesis